MAKIAEIAMNQRILLLCLISLFAVKNSNAQSLTLERLNSQLNQPVFATFAPNASGRLYVVEKEGAIRIMVRSTGELFQTDFMTVPGVESGGSERGLLGMAFHPDFENNGYFYVNFTDTTGSDTQVVRFTANSLSSADPESGFKILEIDQPQSTHNGGWIGFGDDGYLYVSVGDGGNSNDNGSGHTAGIGNAQDTTNNLLGKVLRIDIDNDDFPSDPQRNYAIPADNPFVNDPADDEIFVYGMRNPWRCSFDRDNGDLYIGDVGQGSREEVTVIPSTSGGGENLGWRLREGLIETSGSVGGPAPGAIDPIYDYEHGGGPLEGFSVTGGYVYRGPIESLQGHYFFGDYVTGNLWSLIYDGSSPNSFDGTNFTDFTNWQNVVSNNGGAAENFSSFAEDFFGDLYILDFNDGEIFRVVAGNPEPTVGSFGGNVAVTVSNGDLRVVGENDTDQFIIVSATETAGRYIFSSVGGDSTSSTTFNNQPTLTVNGVTDDMRFDIRSGRNVLILTESDGPGFVVPDDLRITSTGDEATIVILDTVNVAGRTDVRTRNGDDAILIDDCSFAERLRVSTSNGNDVVIDGNSGAASVCDDDLDINTGSGDDDAVCIGTIVMDRCTIRMGSDNDATAIEDCLFGQTRILGNGGTDRYGAQNNVMASLQLRQYEDEDASVPAIVNQAFSNPTYQEAELFFTLLGLYE